MSWKVYHVGYLSADRRRDEELDRLAAELAGARERGEIFLAQRRASGRPGAYIYVWKERKLWESLNGRPERWKRWERLSIGGLTVTRSS